MKIFCKGKVLSNRATVLKEGFFDKDKTTKAALFITVSFSVFFSFCFWCLYKSANAWKQLLKACLQRFLMRLFGM